MKLGFLKAAFNGSNRLYIIRNNRESIHIEYIEKFYNNL